MINRSQKIFYAKTSVIVAAIIALLIVTKPAILWFTPIAIILGYLFGKLTCGAHFKKFGIVLTVLVFALVNFAHSLVDGIAFLGISGAARYAAVYGHELVRQPLLYVVFLAMLEPFAIPRWMRIVLAILVVTGIWFLGYDAGSHLSGITTVVSETVLVQGIWFFIGDIVHHLADDRSRAFKKQH
ncbi:MAG: hypothetical protein JWM20_777 [Patescibacteria group bacterium]|nr:hypothetical protein [Patescibacteria group bacterium]